VLARLRPDYGEKEKVNSKGTDCTPFAFAFGDCASPPKRSRATVRENGGEVRFHFSRFGVVCRTMKDKHDVAESVPDKAGAGAAASADDDVELTPKEEAAAANQLPPDEHVAKIEKKLEHDAAAANRLPQTEQLAKFEKKLEHDDSGNQPS
jgi:hypothetical protein